MRLKYLIEQSIEQAHFASALLKFILNNNEVKLYYEVLNESCIDFRCLIKRWWT
ncbi:TPA: hypothetical protein JAJ74_001785 [Legionella pneumophila]|nr:hypothetical protein [Legionella pneumophila]HAT6337585.1 hypothetical protein [Legionella pneumophila]HAT6340179.1 hypothetical protein [Legionella pneumophila]HAT6347964.1 hypothetical protein [Legionella pneumophila]HAT6355107.1 hypothetical protein [Legionella pneumophila]